mmetsp:Transcript_639/g.4288  ORF Transcript_639/g.4288 Transcript_639/m.4288 type:complete len:351 (-) Transcript_639:434-1486(-)
MLKGGVCDGCEELVRTGDVRSIGRDVRFDPIEASDRTWFDTHVQPEPFVDEHGRDVAHRLVPRSNACEHMDGFQEPRKAPMSKHNVFGSQLARSADQDRIEEAQNRRAQRRVDARRFGHAREERRAREPPVGASLFGRGRQQRCVEDGERWNGSEDETERFPTQRQGSLSRRTNTCTRRCSRRRVSKRIRFRTIGSGRGSIFRGRRRRGTGQRTRRGKHQQATRGAGRAGCSQAERSTSYGTRGSVGSAASSVAGEGRVDGGRQFGFDGRDGNVEDTDTNHGRGDGTVDASTIRPIRGAARHRRRPGCVRFCFRQRVSSDGHGSIFVIQPGVASFHFHRFHDGFANGHQT